MRKALPMLMPPQCKGRSVLSAAGPATTSVRPQGRPPSRFDSFRTFSSLAPVASLQLGLRRAEQRASAGLYEDVAGSL
jgi:hypothetical protein